MIPRRCRATGFLLLAVALIITADAHSQVRNPIELEFGINSSGLPRHFRRKYATEWILPVVSPLVGVWASSSPEKRLGLTAGLQVYQSGEISRERWAKYSPLAKAMSSSKTVEKMIFRQISSAVLGTWAFKVGSAKLSVVMGGRVSKFTGGSYYYRRRSQNYFYEKGIDPFATGLHTSAKQIYRQVCLGMTLAWSTRWKASLTFSQGSGLYFVEPTNSWCLTGFAHWYSRGDVAMTLRYRVM